MSGYTDTVVGSLAILSEKELLYIRGHALRFFDLAIWKFLREVPQYANHMAAFSPFQKTHLHTPNNMSGHC